MRGVIIIGTILALAPAALAESALDAVKLLPPGQSARIARIEGREGAPDPDRWYILTQDPAADNGVHEFVVSNGQVVASRSLSQFADTLKPGDILGDLPLIDSDKAAKLAQYYAAANGEIITTINYELKKDAVTGAPVWTISCIDDKGAKLGNIVVTAGKGDVVSHDGFLIEPAPVAGASPSPVAEKKEPHFQTYANPDVATVANSSAADTETETLHHHRPSPSPKPKSVVTKTLDTVGHTLQKFLPF